jgi:hypothetical protein
MAGFPRALRVLDEVQHAAQLERFDPGRFAAALGEEAPPPGQALAELGGLLDATRGLLADVDRFVEKSMRIRLNQLEGPLPPQLRTLLSSTIVAYAGDLRLLRERVAGILARLDPRTAAAATDRVLDAAGQALATRAALRQEIFALAQRVAGEWLPRARQAARDRSQADDERERWARTRVDLEQLAARGEILDTGSVAERLERIAAPAPEVPDGDEPDDPAAKRFSLIEID